MGYHKSITESKAKEQLGKFQFKTEMEMNKLGKNLSGGEMVRLIMAMITTFPIDLLILDEPTNNLDVETVEVLIKSLNNFRGAVMIVSHNIDFLNKINIKTAYLIKDKKLKPMKTDPSHKEDFYKALTE
jgi:ATPase subunit of ABC transporter with duplicated ATPase domains